MPDPRPEGRIASEEVVVPGGGTPAATDARELESKYFDWCSARLAERFLELSPDEIYEIAERRATADGAPGLGLLQGRVPEAGSAAFRGVVERVTEVLAREIGLPSFEVWRELYRQAPEQYDAELLGLWRARL